MQQIKSKENTSYSNVKSEAPNNNEGEIKHSSSKPVPLPEGTSCVKILKQFVHLDFTEEEALMHWNNIIANSQSLEKCLNRPVGIHTAIVDYFTNKTHLLTSPLIVEVNLFRQTERMAMIDALTGLFNRRYMEILLRKEVNRCERYDKEFSIAILDIDNFKVVNDTKGHQFGDEVLRRISRLIDESVRNEDMVCRYGGEEFLAILPETDSEGAMILVNRMRDALKADEFFRLHGITFSAGISSYPLSAQTQESLIFAADSALYQAKYSGKDRVINAGADRRKFGRFSVPWDIKFFADKKDSPLTGIVAQNVSLGGIQFDCPVQISIDTKLQLVLMDPDKTEQDVPAEGIITWVKKKRNTYRYGIRFIEIPEVLKENFQKKKAIMNTLKN